MEALKDFKEGLLEGVVECLGILVEIFDEFEDVSLVGRDQLLDLREHLHDLGAELDFLLVLVHRYSNYNHWDHILNTFK